MRKTSNSGKNTEPFERLKDRFLKPLAMYVPVVDRVHGQHHPEFHEVRRLWEDMAARISAAGQETPQLGDVFARLREVTGGYLVPEDVCESYEAVYRMLRDLDQAYPA